MKDPKLAPLLKMVSVVFILMPVISLLRGFFQGQGEMLPTAVSQVSEQLIRVFTILATAIYPKYSSISHFMWSVLGLILDRLPVGLVAVIILLFFWLRSREERLKEKSISTRKKDHKGFYYTMHYQFVSAQCYLFYFNWRIL